MFSASDSRIVIKASNGIQPYVIIGRLSLYDYSGSILTGVAAPTSLMDVKTSGCDTEFIIPADALPRKYKIISSVITTGHNMNVADNPLKRNLRFTIRNAGTGWGAVKIKLRSEEFIYGPDEPGFVPLWDVLNKP